MFFDGTSCLQIASSTFFVRILEDDEYLPLIISSCIIYRNEASEEQSEEFLDAK